MVFDASAILAILNRERGAETALAHLHDGASISVVNAGELLGKLVSRGADPLEARRTLEDLEFIWIPPDASQAGRVGELGAIKDLSLADRFCIALAEARNEPLVTADQDWRTVPIRVPVEYIR